MTMTAVNIDELKPGIETDRLVAECLGLTHKGSKRVWVEHPDYSGGRRFEPSTDLEDAVWAVKVFGKMIEINLLPREHTRVNIYPDDREIELVTTGDAPTTMAICKAILILKEQP